ncbi:MAG: cell division protein ZapA [Lewinella sp.]|nr:cell division protein ZapA [Lewinella sp.]
MEGKNNRQITVLIAGRPYPLKIKDSDEPTIRKIVKEINDKINQFQLTYTNKDKQDCLSMAILTYAVDLHKYMQTGQATTPDNEVDQKLSQIDSLLDKLLA